MNSLRLLNFLTIRSVAGLCVVATAFAVQAADDSSSRIITIAQAKETKDQAKEPAKVPAKEDKNSGKPLITPEREAAVMTFVRLNHPELEALLIHLREARPKEHDKALRELFRVTERLGQIQDRDSDLYELEVRLWKSQSRLQLLLARLQMTGSEESKQDDLKKQVREAVQEQFEVKLLMLERNEKRLTEQARKAQDDLAKMKAEKEHWIERQINLLSPASSGAKIKASKESKDDTKNDDVKKPTSASAEK